ncbi:hypothetical protein Sjap_022908 [Stephania japonica]|uniref:Uncharacterized protein n=1 Tax=Stephania japonica TaxID=461633 RepID=A0AAP0HUU3_9MAGN
MATNLSRKLAQRAISSSLMENKHLLHPLIALQRSLYSTTKPKTPKKLKPQQSPEQRDLETETHSSSNDDIADDRQVMLYDDAKRGRAWARPSEIPWQAKVVNSVNLIGLVGMPVQFESSADGKYWAGTILEQEKNSNLPPIWIPLVFEGDLAHVAACHLKEKDLVHVAGRLVVDPPQFRVEQGNSSVQVMVDNLNFVEKSYQPKESHTSHKQHEQSTNFSADARTNGSSMDSLWRELVSNPNKWWDNRKAKIEGLISTKHPDFKHKDSRQGLWISTGPGWALLKLEGLEFDSSINPSQGKEVRNKKELDEQSWNDLLDNPNKWWDNRSDKRNARAPDFKHKETGKGLWLDSSPIWVRDQLPPSRSINSEL